MRPDADAEGVEATIVIDAKVVDDGIGDGEHEVDLDDLDEALDSGDRDGYDEEVEARRRRMIRRLTPGQGSASTSASISARRSPRRR